ncbi:MAG: carboxylating nicotinate-nucleotide diphosphorylase [Gammaproteobacteria bacterium]|nr:carboxylating nicotinate-nucleotide diphosphorylase [Gammaproteobacteria bacterium]
MKPPTPPQAHEIDLIVKSALQEDLGTGDVTGRLLPDQAQGVARIVCREDAVICGRPWFDAVFQQVAPQATIHWKVEEGSRVGANTLLCEVQGAARALLTAERTALNFLQTLSGTATATRRLADLLVGTRTRLLDTRKTLPGLRVAQKYAVRCGGGHNHRMGLYDAILIKENHIAAAGSITAAVAAARRLAPQLLLEVEVESLVQLEEALAVGTPRILLDNMDVAMLHEAVAITHGRAELEASGGIDAHNLRAVAETGVDFVSLGGLTKHVRAVDLSLRYTPAA